MIQWTGKFKVIVLLEFLGTKVCSYNVPYGSKIWLSDLGKQNM